MTGTADLVPHVAADGLAQRTEAELDRERAELPEQVAVVARAAGSSPAADGGVALADLEAAFAGEDTTVLPSASFVAGRCRTPDGGVAPGLDPLLDGVLTARPVQQLRSLASGYVEAAMAVALRGRVAEGHDRLLPVLEGPRGPSLWDYLAAYYLAQMGDPVGYPNLVASLDSDTEHRRLMAARHFLGFVPFAGQAVGGQVVDPVGQLRRCLEDPSPYVYREVPGLLAEIGAPDLTGLLGSLDPATHPPELLEAARAVLAASADEGT